jgi:hypothetical protein
MQCSSRLRNRQCFLPPSLSRLELPRSLHAFCLIIQLSINMNSFTGGIYGDESRPN